MNPQVKTAARRRRVVLALAAGMAVLAASGCPRVGPASRGEQPAGKLVLTGSSTVAPLAAEIAKRYEGLYPGVRIDVQSGGSSRGISDARRGLADVGMVSRALKEGEEDLRAFPIARDGICMIVHGTSPIRELTGAQIADIYTGRITNWREVGGVDRRIVVVNKAQGRSTLELFLAHFKLESSAIRAHIVIGDNQQGIKTVAGSRAAIGYVSIGSAEYDARHGTRIKLLPLGGVAATTASVRDGSYPLSRDLNLVTLGEPGPLAAAFIEFARWGETGDLAEKLSFVSIAN